MPQLPDVREPQAAIALDGENLVHFIDAIHEGSPRVEYMDDSIGVQPIDAQLGAVDLMDHGVVEPPFEACTEDEASWCEPEEMCLRIENVAFCAPSQT